MRGGDQLGRERRARVQVKEEVLAQGHEDQEDQDEFFDQADPKVFPHQIRRRFCYIFPFALYHRDYCTSQCHDLATHFLESF